MKKLMHDDVDVFLIALSSPIKIGIYKENKLIDIISSDEKSSEILPLLFEEIFKKYNVKKLFFVNGPGSFMAIKVAYIFLKSISVMKNIPLYATDAFKFNSNAPIKAFGKLFFVKVSDKIITQKFDVVQESCFELPSVLHYSDFSDDTAPKYFIDAVS